MEECVQPGCLVVEWRERQAFLRDEERAKLVKTASREDSGPVRREAVEWILGSTGEADAEGLGRDGVLVADVEAVRRVAARAGITEPVEDLHPLAFVDRHGCLHLPYAAAEKLARNFAAVEPQTFSSTSKAWRRSYEPRATCPAATTPTIFSVAGDRRWHWLGSGQGSRRKPRSCAGRSNASSRSAAQRSRP